MSRNRYIIVVDIEDEADRSPEELVQEVPHVVEGPVGSLDLANATVYKSLADFDADRAERLGAFHPSDDAGWAIGGVT